MTPQEHLAIRAAMCDVRAPVIVELGARGGEDEAALRCCCSEPARYLMVEPDMRNCQLILNRPFESDVFTSTNRRLILGAVACYDGLVTFHGCDSPDGSRTSGSIRQPSGHLKYFPGHLFGIETTVPCYTLDTIFRCEGLAKIDLLWVDIQGAERDMIQGGGFALAHTRYLFIEAETEELYAGEALKPELLALLGDHGFALVQDFGCNVLLERK